MALVLPETRTYDKTFNRLKQLIKYFYILETRQTGLTATNYPLLYIRNEIITPFDTDSLTELIANLDIKIQSQIDAYSALKYYLIQAAEAVLLDLAPYLGVTNATVLKCIDALILAMLKDSKTVANNTLTIASGERESNYEYTDQYSNESGTIAPNTTPIANTGDGRLVYTFAQPGVLKAFAKELAKAEVMNCICTTAGTDHSEIFTLYGEAERQIQSAIAGGSGQGPTLTVAGNTISNGDMQTWASTPLALTGWDITGTWATDVSREASVIHEDTYSAKLINVGKALISPALTLTPDSIYCVGFWARVAEDSAAGNLYVEVIDLDDSNAQIWTEEVSLDTSETGEITTSFAFYYFTFITPHKINENPALSFRTNAATQTAVLYLDMIQITKMVEHNGINFAAFASTTPFGIGDKFGFGGDDIGFAVSESEAGQNQKFFARCWNKQLPSLTDESETQADAS